MDEMKRHYAAMSKDPKTRSYCVIHSASNEKIGIVNFMNIEESHRRYRILAIGFNRKKYGCIILMRVFIVEWRWVEYGMLCLGNALMQTPKQFFSCYNTHLKHKSIVGKKGGVHKRAQNLEI
jgi:hypothetical protein